jgi:hypothetical protein
MMVFYLRHADCGCSHHHENSQSISKEYKHNQVKNEPFPPTPLEINLELHFGNS